MYNDSTDGQSPQFPRISFVVPSVELTRPSAGQSSGAGCSSAAAASGRASGKLNTAAETLRSKPDGINLNKEPEILRSKHFNLMIIITAASFGVIKDNFAFRKNQVLFSMAIGNVELVRECLS